MSGSQRKLVANFFYQASYQVLVIVLPIVTVPVVARALGPSGVGTYGYINSIAAYFILVAGLGMANYGVREISLVRDDKRKLSAKFWELQIFNSLISITTFFAFVLLGFFTNQVSLYLITSLSVLSCVFDISWFFAGIEDFRSITFRSFIVKIVSFVFIVLFIRTKNDLFTYFLITSVSMLVSEMSLWIRISRYIFWVPPTFKACLQHLKPALSFFVAKIAVTLYQNTTKTILGLVTTMTVVGYYTNGFMLVLMTANVINSMNTIMIPRMSHLYGEHDEDAMIKTLQQSLHFQMFLTIPCMFGIALVSSKLVPWFFGDKFLILVKVIPLLAPVAVFQSFQTSVAAQYLIPRKEMKQYNISIFIGAGLTILATLVFAPFVGIYGAIIGINLGYFVVSILRGYVLVRDTDFRFEWGRIIKWVVSGIVMYVATLLMTNSEGATPITTMIQVISGVVIYLTMSFILKVNPLAEFLLKIKKT